MSTETGEQEGTVRTAELVASLSLATDLGMGLPFEHGLQVNLMAMRLAESLGVAQETCSETYYLSLLVHTGCTTDAEISSRIFGSGVTHNVGPVQFGSTSETLSGILKAMPPPGASGGRRAFEIARRIPLALRYQNIHFVAACEVAEMIAESFGMSPSVQSLFFYLNERWDGKSVLRRASAEAIPLPIRIAEVAADVAFQRLLWDDEKVVALISERSGHAFDPKIADAFVARADEIFEAADAPESVWEATLAAEPKPWLRLDGKAVDRALGAMAAFTDLISPWLSGHSAGVAELVSAAAPRFGLDPGETSTARRAALLHDVGRVAVDPGIWRKAGPLTADDWEQVRLHAYHTERVLSRSPFLSSFAQVACSHHERVDGSGYHRAVAGASLPPGARLLAAADVFHAMTEPRSHRDALSVTEAARALSEEVHRGSLDPHAVAAVLEAAGQIPPTIELPAGLTEREAQVVGLLARGLQTKQVANTLGISIKTADRHIQNAYRKIGCSTRAAAAVFAMENGLMQWGELPIPRRRGGS